MESTQFIIGAGIDDSGRFDRSCEKLRARQRELEREDRRSRAIEGTIEALSRYELALKNREHGGVAADRCIREIKEAFEC
jgi:hypothetical protein